MGRFWAKITVAGPDDCWLWTASTNGKGYGVHAGNTWRHYAHRYAFWLAYGRWPNVCRHSCDVRGCCNPAHLLDGTTADNARDMVARGRHAAQTHPDWQGDRLRAMAQTAARKRWGHPTGAS